MIYDETGDTDVTGVQIKKIRARLGLSQVQLAKAMRCSVGTVRNWEQERGGAISGMAITILEMFDLLGPDVVQSLLETRSS